jgi:hypothetical protein
MSEEAIMRARLQQVAAYRELCRSVARGGRDNVAWALLMLGLAYYSFRPNANGLVAIVFMLYVGLALAELTVGLFKLLLPCAEGVLLDAFILILFAGWNLGWQGLAMAAGRPPEPVLVALGLFILFGAFGKFRAYGELRRLFAERPDPQHMAWFDDLVHEIRTSDPSTDPLALDLPTRPHWRAKLLGGTAFFVSTIGNTVWVAGTNDFTLRREKTDHGTGHRRAQLSIHGADYPEFELSDASWENYTKWMSTQAPPRPA